MKTIIILFFCTWVAICNCTAQDIPTTVKITTDTLRPQSVFVVDTAGNVRKYETSFLLRRGVENYNNYVVLREWYYDDRNNYLLVFCYTVNGVKIFPTINTFKQ